MMRKTNIVMTGLPERDEKRAESIFRGKIAENFPKLGKKLDIQD